MTLGAHEGGRRIRPIEKAPVSSLLVGLK
jgi:hypothetical protein